LKVYLPSPLYSYTGGKSLVEARGDTIREVLAALDAQYPGMAFRMVDEVGHLRRHIRIFVDERPEEDLDTKVQDPMVLHIVAALSGG